MITEIYEACRYVDLAVGFDCTVLVHCYLGYGSGVIEMRWKASRVDKREDHSRSRNSQINQKILRRVQKIGGKIAWKETLKTRKIIYYQRARCVDREFEDE